MRRLRYLIFFVNVFSSIAFSFHTAQMWAQNPEGHPTTYYPPRSPVDGSLELLSVMQPSDIELPFDSFEFILVAPKDGKNPYAKWAKTNQLIFRFEESIEDEVASIVHQARSSNQQLLVPKKCKTSIIATTLQLQDCLHYGAPNQQQTWIVLLNHTYSKNGLYFSYLGQNFSWKFSSKEQRLGAGAMIEDGKRRNKRVEINTVVIYPERVRFLPLHHLIRLVE